MILCVMCVCVFLFVLYVSRTFSRIFSHSYTLFTSCRLCQSLVKWAHSVFCFTTHSLSNASSISGLSFLYITCHNVQPNNDGISLGAFKPNFTLNLFVWYIPQQSTIFINPPLLTHASTFVRAPAPYLWVYILRVWLWAKRIQTTSFLYRETKEPTNKKCLLFTTISSFAFRTPLAQLVRTLRHILTFSPK